MEAFKTILINVEQLEQFLNNLILINTIPFQTFFIKFYGNFLILVSQPSIIFYLILKEFKPSQWELNKLIWSVAVNAFDCFREILKWKFH